MLTQRMVGIGTEFKSFLQEHQKVLKKQEAKKERLIGAGLKSSILNANDPTSVGGVAGMGKGIGASSNSLSNKRKMKILPQHVSQQANRQGGRGISGARVFNADAGVGGGDDASTTDGSSFLDLEE